MISPIRALKSLPVQREAVEWEAVYAGLLPRVYNYFRYRTSDEATAEDLTAITFEKAWRKRESYRRDLSAFSTWVFRIAQRVAADYYRRERPSLDLNEDLPLGGGCPVEDQVDRNDDLARLAALCQDLSARERNLVALKYGADLTNREIARLAGLSESNVGTILNRVVARLRQHWEGGE